MRSGRMVLVVLLGLWGCTTAQAGVRWSIGVGVGVPCWGYPGPYYGPGYGYYYRPVYLPPPTVIVQPTPVAVAVPVPPPAPAPVSTCASVEQPCAPPPAPGYSVSPVAAPTSGLAVVARSARPDIERVTGLASTEEGERARAAVEAGRRKDRRALGQLQQLLRQDSSPQVRDAAARGLGLIGDPSSLAALQHAAQADEDREVRHSAAFAAEVIRGNLPR